MSKDQILPLTQSFIATNLNKHFAAFKEAIKLSRPALELGPLSSYASRQYHNAALRSVCPL